MLRPPSSLSQTGGLRRTVKTNPTELFLSLIVCPLLGLAYVAAIVLFHHIVK